jgi:hypothetical protein
MFLCMGIISRGRMGVFFCLIEYILSKVVGRFIVLELLVAGVVDAVNVETLRGTRGSVSRTILPSRRFCEAIDIA